MMGSYLGPWAVFLVIYVSDCSIIFGEGEFGGKQSMKIKGDLKVPVVSKFGSTATSYHGIAVSGRCGSIPYVIGLICMYNHRRPTGSMMKTRKSMNKTQRLCTLRKGL